MNAPPSDTPSRPPAHHLLIAFALLYVVWGSTYLGMAVAIETMPPFLMAAVRFIVAGGILFAARRLAGDALPSARNWGSAALVGTLLFVGGNGVVCWAQHWVPSGVAALLIASTPLWMTMLPWFVGRTGRPRTTVLIGIALGLAGVGTLVGAPVGAAPASQVVIGSLAIIAASLSWTIGSLWSKALPMPASPWMSSALQMICGAVGLGLASMVAGEPRHVQLDAISLRSWLALVYLTLIGAIVGFGAFVYLMRWSTPSRVSTYAFVNPVVAVLLGWLIAGEPITSTTLLAGGLIVAAVAMILLPKPAVK